MEGHAESMTSGDFPLAPAGFLRHEFEDAPHSSRVIAAGRRADHPRLAQEVEAELDLVLSGGVGQLIEERVHHEGDGIAAGRPEGAGGHAERDGGLFQSEGRDEPGRELGCREPGAAGELVALAEGDEVVPPADDPAVPVHAALQEMEAGRPVEVVLDVVFPGPEELDRGTGLLRDPGGLDHVVVREPAPESAAGPSHVDRDGGLVDA